MIYIDDGLKEYTRQDFEKILVEIPPWRLERVKNLSRFEDRLQNVLAYRLLVKALKEEFDLRTVPEFSLLENGKPYFKEYPDIHFNISHCSRAVACAVSTRPVGIDVECINPFDEELASYVLNEEEYDTIIKSGRPDIEFTILWTCKESLCKFSGRGLPTQEEIRCILSKHQAKIETVVNECGGYVMSVASREDW